MRVSEHRGADDLLTAGLGLDGLRAMAAPAFADPEHPTAAELRRRAIWSNWRGIADLVPGGGYGELYGSVANVPGREFSALATVPGARQPHRVLAQVPDAFDQAKRCVVVTASSGSRGIYGSIAVAGAWGLPKGCAVAYTDKGAGTDYVDLAAGPGAAEDAGAAFVPATDRHQRHCLQARALAGQSGSGLGPPCAAGRGLRAAIAQCRVPGRDAVRLRQYPRHRGGHFQWRRRGVARGRTRAATWLDAVVAGEPNITADGSAPALRLHHRSRAADAVRLAAARPAADAVRGAALCRAGRRPA